ncbi:hypothetical protein HTS61_02460 [Escherichia coli]|nr:hypothetical protein [Escherichia coli]
MSGKCRAWQGGGALECDKGYTSLYAMLKISALSEVRASWRLHGGVRQV